MNCQLVSQGSQYHKHSYRGGVVGGSNLKFNIWPNGIDSGCFQPHILQKVAKSMLSLPVSSVVIPCWLFARPGNIGMFIDQLGTYECQTSKGRGLYTHKLVVYCYVLWKLCVNNAHFGKSGYTCRNHSNVFDIFLQTSGL